MDCRLAVVGEGARVTPPNTRERGGSETTRNKSRKSSGGGSHRGCDRDDKGGRDGGGKLREGESHTTPTNCARLNALHGGGSYHCVCASTLELELFTRGGQHGKSERKGGAQVRVGGSGDGEWRVQGLLICIQGENWRRWGEEWGGTTLTTS